MDIYRNRDHSADSFLMRTLIQHAKGNICHALQEFNVSDFVLRAVFFFSSFCLSDKLLFLLRTFPNCFSFRLSAILEAITSKFSFSSSPTSRPGRLLDMKVSKLILMLLRLMLSPVFLAISTNKMRINKSQVMIITL